MEEKNLKQLQEENDFRSELISVTAHSLRTSLSAMKWMLQMFIDKDFGDLSIEQEGMIKKAAENNERMINAVNEMIKVNKTMEHSKNIEKVDVDMVKLIDSLVFDFSAESFKHGVQIIFVKPENECTLKSDPEKLRLIFSNLIENAIKYSANNDKIFISIKDKDGQFTFTVKDTGIGIPKEDQKHVFEKFYRAGNAMQKESMGSGIGLYTVKKNVDLLSGQITFESSGLGTTFDITLKK